MPTTMPPSPHVPFFVPTLLRLGVAPDQSYVVFPQRHYSAIFIPGYYIANLIHDRAIPEEHFFPVTKPVHFSRCAIRSPDLGPVRLDVLVDLETRNQVKVARSGPVSPHADTEIAPTFLYIQSDVSDHIVEHLRPCISFTNSTRKSDDLHSSHPSDRTVGYVHQADIKFFTQSLQHSDTAVRGSMGVLVEKSDLGSHGMMSLVSGGMRPQRSRGS